jgi:hypothetical protein
LAGSWRELHNEELHKLYSSISINAIIKDAMSRTCSTNGEESNVFRLLVGKPERNLPLARPRLRRVYNIKMDLGEIVWGGVDWIGLAQNRD